MSNFRGGVLVEVLDGEAEVVDLAVGLVLPQRDDDAPAFAETQDVMFLVFAARLQAVQRLVELRGSLQILHAHGDVVDAAAVSGWLPARFRGDSARRGDQHREALDEVAPGQPAASRSA